MNNHGMNKRFVFLELLGSILGGLVINSYFVRTCFPGRYKSDVHGKANRIINNVRAYGGGFCKTYIKVNKLDSRSKH